MKNWMIDNPGRKKRRWFDAVMVVLIIAIVAVIFIATARSAESNFGNVTVKWVRCYDGDTCTFNVPSWPPIIGRKISVRILGIDTPEIRGKCDKEKVLAIKARDTVRVILGTANTERREIELRNMRRGKYFRILSDVFVDDMNVAQYLIYMGLARPYQGGKRKSWCTE